MLGGAEVTLLEHTAAFTVFAREGSVVTPVSILKVQDSRGTTLEEWRTPAVTDTFDPEAARQINDILSDNSARTYIFGAKNHLTLPGRSVAAKKPVPQTITATHGRSATPFTGDGCLGRQ